jgi:hypothetical protein
MTDQSNLSSPHEAVGEHSRPLRFLLSTLVVAVYWGLGRLLQLNLAEYQLLGIPFLLVFQWVIQRRSLLTLWVRSGSPLKMDARFYILWMFFSIVPAFEVFTSVKNNAYTNAALFATGIAGAFSLAYALKAMRRENWWQLVLCILTAGTIALLPLILPLILPVHLHINGVNPTAGAASSAFLPQLQAGLETFFWGLPAGFWIEEVFFRGAIDTYLHRGEKGTGWLSAIFVSALWGLWHLSGAALTGGHLLSTILGLLIAQILVGVPLSLWWRKSGNLVVNNTTHALIDAVRSLLAAA